MTVLQKSTIAQFMMFRMFIISFYKFKNMITRTLDLKVCAKRKRATFEHLKTSNTKLSIRDSINFSTDLKDVALNQKL